MIRERLGESNVRLLLDGGISRFPVLSKLSYNLSHRFFQSTESK